MGDRPIAACWINDSIRFDVKKFQKGNLKIMRLNKVGLFICMVGFMLSFTANIFAEDFSRFPKILDISTY